MIAVVLFAGLTDFLDGYIARKSNQRTRLGATLDPLADKVLFGFFVLGGVLSEQFPLWMLFSLVIRDLFVTIALPVFLLFFRSKMPKDFFVIARFPGKVVTCMQFLAAAVLIFAPRELWQHPPSIFTYEFWVFYLLYPCSVWAIGDYAYHYISLLGKESTQDLEPPLP